MSDYTYSNTPIVDRFKESGGTTEYYVADSEARSNLNDHSGNDDIHVTAEQKTTWTGKQDKLAAGSNITIASDGKTISATDTTYSSKSAASGGTDVSLVTTGEKYTWNNKTSNTGTVTSVTVTGANGLSGSGTVTSSGTITLSNSGVRSITQNSSDGHKLTINTNGTNSTITIPDNNTTYSSLSAASGGTAVSLVTTGEKYTWNAKQAAISDLSTIRSNASSAKSLVDSLFYKSGDVVSLGSCTLFGYTTSSSKTIHINVPLAKSLANINSATLTTLKANIANKDGYGITSSFVDGGSNYLVSSITRTVYIRKEINTVEIMLTRSSAFDLQNNDTVQCRNESLVMTLSS